MTLVEYGIALIMMVTLGTVALAGLAGGVDARLDSACGTLDTNIANCAGSPD